MAVKLARKKPPAASSLTTLADQLHSAAIHLLRGLRVQDAASGLSAPRLSALSVLVFGGPRTVSALATAEQVRVPTMTRLVQALEGDGLVTCAPDPNDGRRVIVRPTLRGTKLLHAGRRRRVEALAGQLATLSNTDRDSLERAAAVLVSLHLAAMSNRATRKS